jgi:N-acetylmuramoyl-L-alanine amidase
MFLSIHLNAYTSSTWYGAQTFYTNNNKNNIVLAEIIQKNFKKKLNTNRNIKNINNRYLYDNLDKLGVLLEVGFITNVNERNLLIQDNYQYKISYIILESIIEYFNK